MRDALQSIHDYTTDGKNAFFEDKKTQDAVLRNIEIVGEAAKKLSDEFKAANPEYPWKQMAGMRDKVIHNYFGVNLDIVWQTVGNRVPDLLAKITSLLQTMDP